MKIGLVEKSARKRCYRVSAGMSASFSEVDLNGWDVRAIDETMRSLADGPLVRALIVFSEPSRAKHPEEARAQLREIAFAHSIHTDDIGKLLEGEEATDAFAEMIFREAWEEFVRRFGDFVRKQIKASGVKRPEADEVFSYLFTDKLPTALLSFDGRRKLKPYLRKVVSNYCKDVLRKPKPKDSEYDDERTPTSQAIEYQRDPIPDPETALIGKQDEPRAKEVETMTDRLSEKVRECLIELSLQKRLIVELHYCRGLTYKTIAQKIGKKEAAVRKAASRAMQDLANHPKLRQAHEEVRRVRDEQPTA